MIKFMDGHPGGTLQGCAHFYATTPEVECPDCGGDGKVGYRVGDDRDEAECGFCYGTGEVRTRAIDERENGPWL